MKPRGRTGLPITLIWALGNLCWFRKALKLNSRVNLLVCQCSKVQDWIEHMTENYAMNHCWMIYDMTKKMNLIGS